MWRAAVKGEGVDCAKMVWSVLNQFYQMPMMPAHYKQGEVMADDYNLVIMSISLVADLTLHPLPGDVVLFKFGRSFVHCGVVSKAGHMIHAYGRRGAGGVVEQPFTVMGDRERVFYRIREEAIR